MNIRTKILYIYQTLFCAFLSLFVACDDLEDKSTSTTIDGNITETGTAEIYILSEGLFNLNNSSLAKYSFKSNKLVKNYFRFLSVRLNRLKNKLLANYLRNRGNDLATVRNSAFCVAILSNNSFICKYNIFFRKYELSVAIL